MTFIIKLLAKATVIWKLDWKIFSLDDSLKWLGSWYWLLIGGLISSSCGLLYKIAEISSWHGSWLPPKWEFQKPRQKQQCDLWQCSALSLLLAHTPTLSVRGITQGLVYQKARITEGHLEVWIPQLPCDFYYCCWVVGHQNAAMQKCIWLFELQISLDIKWIPFILLEITFGEWLQLSDFYQC